MTTGDRVGHRPVIEVLYVQECCHCQGTLTRVERVRAELGIDAELRTSLIVDQAAAVRAGFPGSPTVRVDGRDVSRDANRPPTTPSLVACTGSSAVSPANPRPAGSARPCWRRPAAAERRRPRWEPRTEVGSALDDLRQRTSTFTSGGRILSIR
jgi:hypothetical protein